MGMHPEQLPGPEAAQAALIKRLIARGAVELSNLAILDDNPGPDEQLNMWGRADGTLWFRTTDTAGVSTDWSITADSLRRYLPPTFQSFAEADGAGYRFFHHGGTGELRYKSADNTWDKYAPVSASNTGNQDEGSPGGSSTTTKQQQTQKKTHRQTFNATWVRSFSQRGIRNTGGGEHRYGRWDGTHGENLVMIGFDDSAIRGFLGNGGIRKVELHVRNADAYSFSGVWIHYGGHNQSGPPGSYSTVRRNVSRGHWPHTGSGAYWRSIAHWFGNNLRDNNIKGIVIDQPSLSRSQYGAIYADVRLALTVRK